MTELERLREKRKWFCEVADNLSSTDVAYWDLLEAIEKLNKKIRKLRPAMKSQETEAGK